MERKGALTRVAISARLLLSPTIPSVLPVANRYSTSKRSNSITNCPRPRVIDRRLVA